MIENNVVTRNGCGLHVPFKSPEPATALGEGWNGKVLFCFPFFFFFSVFSLFFCSSFFFVLLKVHFVNNHVFDNLGPSMRIEKCLDNPHMGSLLGNVVVGNAEQRPLSPALQQALDRGLCTRRATEDQHDFQPWFVLFLFPCSCFFFNLNLLGTSA